MDVSGAGVGTVWTEDRPAAECLWSLSFAADTKKQPTTALAPAVQGWPRSLASETT